MSDQVRLNSGEKIHLNGHEIDEELLAAVQQKVQGLVSTQSSYPMYVPPIEAPMGIAEPVMPTHILPGGRAKRAAMGMARAAQLDAYEMELVTFLYVLAFDLGIKTFEEMDQIFDFMLARLEAILFSRQRRAYFQDAMFTKVDLTVKHVTSMLTAKQSKLSARLQETNDRPLTDRGFEYKGHISEFVDGLFGLNK